MLECVEETATSLKLQRRERSKRAETLEKDPQRILSNVKVDSLKVDLDQELEVCSNRREAQRQELAVRWVQGTGTGELNQRQF